PRRFEPEPETDLVVTEGFEELDRLEFVEIPETDRLEEKHDDIGVGMRFGEEEVDVLWTDALASSSSVDIVLSRLTAGASGRQGRIR
ncbi:MAG: hypothetical protein M1823_008630, partial [Watsoniomyces obsoletus]